MQTRETYRKYLARSPILPAPMCGVTFRPFRELVRKMGAHMVHTPMFSAEAMVRGDPKTFEMMDFKGEKSPVVVQIFGSRAPILAEAARVVESHGADVIDLNLGCPARKITNGEHGSGSALLDRPDNLVGIIRAMRRNLTLPFTVKVRWHDEDSRILEIARMCEAEGVDAIALHARTRRERFKGAAHWDCIGRLKDAVSIPVIGNGDVMSVADVRRMQRLTQCDAVMAGRAIVRNPWFVRDLLEHKRTGRTEGFDPPSLEERMCLLLHHARLMHRYRGDHGLIEFRKHCAGYIRGLPGARVARNELMQVTALDQLQETLERYFGAVDWEKAA